MRSKKMKLGGKVAIVTGAGGGLGRASAIAMARDGASLVILSRTPAELRETAERIKAIGRKVLFIRADVSKPEDIEKVVIPHMIKQRKGKIINVISGLGERVMPPFGAYSVAKAGLIHLTRFMAEELKGYDIQVNGLDPGIMDTRMQEEIRASGPEVLGLELYEQILGWKERGELKPPEKVARLAVFLASAASDSINGECGTETY